MARVVRSGLREDGTPSSVMLGCAIGDIIPHIGTTAPPGTLVCDGSEVSREAYVERYQEIGALCGQGDGSTTFNLPDLRGRWLMGADEEHAAGDEVAEGLPNVTGSLQALICDGIGGTGAFNATLAVSGNRYAVGSNGMRENVSFNSSRSNSIYGASDHVTPASVAVLPCIVYE